MIFCALPRARVCLYAYYRRRRVGDVPNLQFVFAPLVHIINVLINPAARHALVAFERARPGLTPANAKHRTASVQLPVQQPVSGGVVIAVVVVICADTELHLWRCKIVSHQGVCECVVCTDNAHIHTRTHTQTLIRRINHNCLTSDCRFAC